MGHLSNSQKETCKAQTLAWMEELENSRRANEPVRDFEAEGKAALAELAQIKARYATEKTPECLAAYNGALGRALASVALMYKAGFDISACASMNNKTKSTLGEKFGIGASEVQSILSALSSPSLKDRTFPAESGDTDLVAEQLNTPEKVAEKKAPAQEVKPKAEPKAEAPKVEEPVAEAEAPAKKEPDWQKQTNLPDVKTTVPAVVVEGAIRLVKPEKREDLIPFSDSNDTAEKAKAALNSALVNRALFQRERSAESKEAFYRDMSTALLHYSRLTAVMDTTSGRETPILRNRFKNEFGILDKDLKRASTVIYRSEKTVAQAWASGDEAQIEDRLLKIGAPNLTTTEVKAPEPVPEKQPESKPTAMPTEEFGAAEDAPADDRIRISVDVNQSRPAVEETVKKPKNPAITQAQIRSMKEWKEKLAGEDKDRLTADYLYANAETREKLSGKDRDNVIGKMLAMADKFRDEDNRFIYGNVKSLLAENTGISEAEFDVAMEAMQNPNADIMKALTDLKAREFDEQYKVPDAVKNFPYAKQMIDANKKFFDNNYGIPQNDFLAFARKHMETLQNNVKNPPLAEEGNPQKDLFDASVGMYARIRSSYDRRKWYDVLFHPIDSYREHSLMNSMKETMVQNGMSEAQIESLYTGAKEVFGLDSLSNSVSLNGKSSPAEANDKLVDLTEEKPQAENELAASLENDLKQFHGLEQRAESKEIKAPAVENPVKNAPRVD